LPSDKATNLQVKKPATGLQLNFKTKPNPEIQTTKQQQVSDEDSDSFDSAKEMPITAETSLKPIISFKDEQIVC